MSKENKNIPTTPNKDQSVKKIDKSGGESTKSNGQMPTSRNPPRPPKK